MRRVTYKKRPETLTVYFIASQNPHGSYEKEFRKARQQGMYDTGYHYYIDGFGNVIEDRPLEVVASCTFAEHMSSIYVLLETEKEPTDCQKVSIEELMETLEDYYGKLEVIYQ